MAKMTAAVDVEQFNKEFVKLPAGDYEMVYETAPELKTNEKSGKSFYETKLKVLSPESVPVDGELKKVLGQVVFDNIYFNDAAGILKARLTGAGVKFVLEGGNVSFDGDDFIGKKVKATIKHTQDKSDPTIVYSNIARTVPIS